MAPPPVVIMAHGMGGTKDHKLDHIGAEIADAGEAFNCQTSQLVLCQLRLVDEYVVNTASLTAKGLSILIPVVHQVSSFEIL